MMEPSGDQTARAVPSPPPLRRTQGKALREGLKRADQGLWKGSNPLVSDAGWRDVGPWV